MQKTTYQNQKTTSYTQNDKYSMLIVKINKIIKINISIK